VVRYKNHLGKVEFDADAKVLHGEVVGIRDVVTFQADSVGGDRTGVPRFGR
jgi:predicted HicB family RNase H-like nuclease